MNPVSILRMKRTKLPKSVRKHIRLEKARMRREGLDVKEKEKQISELYKSFPLRGIPRSGTKKHEV